MGKLLEQRNRALDDINAGRTVKKIRDLESRVRELEEENARLNSSPTIEACRQMIRDKAVIEASTLPDNGKDKVAYFLPEGVTK